MPLDRRGWNVTQVGPALPHDSSWMGLRFQPKEVESTLLEERQNIAEWLLPITVGNLLGTSGFGIMGVDLSPVGLLRWFGCMLGAVCAAQVRYCAKASVSRRLVYALLVANAVANVVVLESPQSFLRYVVGIAISIGIQLYMLGQVSASLLFVMHALYPLLTVLLLSRFLPALPDISQEAFQSITFVGIKVALLSIPGAQWMWASTQEAMFAKQFRAALDEGHEGVSLGAPAASGAASPVSQQPSAQADPLLSEGTDPTAEDVRRAAQACAWCRPSCTRWCTCPCHPGPPRLGSFGFREITFFDDEQHDTAAERARVKSDLLALYILIRQGRNTVLLRQSAQPVVEKLVGFLGYPHPKTRTCPYSSLVGCLTRVPRRLRGRVAGNLMRLSKRLMRLSSQAAHEPVASFAWMPVLADHGRSDDDDDSAGSHFSFESGHSEASTGMLTYSEMSTASLSRVRAAIWEEVGVGASDLPCDYRKLGVDGFLGLSDDEAATVIDEPCHVDM